MLITDSKVIGSRLYSLRKKAGMTRAEVAESAGLSDRTYADIERGATDMRVSTLLKICLALHISPDEVLTEQGALPNLPPDEVLRLSENSPAAKQDTALQLLSVYWQSP